MLEGVLRRPAWWLNPGGDQPPFLLHPWNLDGLILRREWRVMEESGDRVDYHYNKGISLYQFYDVGKIPNLPVLQSPLL